MAARRARRAGTKKGWDQLAIDTRRRMARRLQGAAQQVVEDLIEIGPAYSGEFSTRWEIQNFDETPAKFSFKSNARDARLGVQIVNTSDYAPEAMDLQPGAFITPEVGPIKQPVETGKRIGPMRGDVVAGEGEAVSTAEADWYATYAQGGAIGESVRSGAASIIIRP